MPSLREEIIEGNRGGFESLRLEEIMQTWRARGPRLSFPFVMFCLAPVPPPAMSCGVLRHHGDVFAVHITDHRGRTANFPAEETAYTGRGEYRVRMPSIIKGER